MDSEMDHTEEDWKNAPPQYGRILIPADSKEMVELIIPFAMKFLRSGGEIVTIHVIDSSHPLDIIGQWKKGTRISLAAVETGYRHEVKVTPKVVNHKSIVGGILEEIRKENYDLLLFVIKPHPGKKNFRLGSKTRNIAKSSVVDIMMVTQLTLLMDSRQGTKILAVTSERSNRKKIIGIAKVLSQGIGNGSISELHITASQKRGADITAGPPAGGRKVIRRRSTAELIIDEVASGKFSVLVLSSRLSPSALPFYRGSLFEHIIRESPCPVVIYRGAR
jgi:nucleotide-binding universal stress UspA family protein